MDGNDSGVHIDARMYMYRLSKYYLGTLADIIGSLQFPV